MAMALNQEDSLRDGIAEICGLPDGVDIFGVAPVERFDGLPENNRPAAFLPEAKSVIVLGSQLFMTLTKRLTTQRKVGEVSMRNLFNNHNEFVTHDVYQTAYRVARFLTNQGYDSINLGNYLTDDRTVSSVFRFKYAAKQAGLGATGKNGLLITKAFGPRIKLGAVLSTAPLNPDPLLSEDLCQDCDICIKVCPSGALKEPLEPGVPNHDRFICSAFLTANNGCGMCLAKCPR